MSLTQRVFSERRRVIVPVLVFLIANLAALGVVFWMQRTIDDAQASTDQAILDLGSARNAERAAKNQQAGKELADVQLRKFYSEILPKNLASAVNVTNFWLGRIAKSAKVNFRQAQYDHEQIRDSRLTKVSGEITLIGAYADIRRFLYELETSQEFIVIEKVALSQPNSTQGNAQLEVQLSVATYFLTGVASGVVSK